MEYKNGTNELDVIYIYNNIRSLSTHTGRGWLGFHYSKEGQEMVLHQCTDEFRNIFWECCAALLNYFADFLSTDNTKNKIIWFHMLNVFQDAAVLPHNFNSTQFPSCDHAEAFAREYEESLKLMNDVIMADDFLRDDVVHRSIGLTEPATYQTGPWMNGMKPWDQYLMADSPGLDVPIGDREYPEGVKAPDTEAKKDADAEENEEPEVGFGQQLGRQETGVIRCVPSGGLAIVQKHTDTARILGAHYAANDDEIDQDAFIAEFDNNCVRLDGPSKYTNLAGNIVTTLPFRPAPNARNAPHQVEGWYDPSGMIDNPEPWMLDEMVANYRGDPPQVHPGGQGGNWMMQVQEEPEANGTEPVYEGPGVIIPLNPIWEAWACGEPCCIGQ